MKKIVIATVFIMLFCGNAIAKECKSQGGTFEVKSLLVVSTCPKTPTTVSHGDVKIGAVECGPKLDFETQTTKSGCIIKLWVLSVVEEKTIGGFSIMEMTCPIGNVRKCRTVYELSFTPKTKPVKQEKKSDPIRQQTDSE
jgi:hypothetical protein